ncbi:DUF2975 domain-containing protein [Duganella guangzhouensis]|nr:DUF2975 domain-containing protein [Duganella guangzhouensis]
MAFPHPAQNHIRYLCMVLQVVLQIFLVVQVSFFILAWSAPVPLQPLGWHMQVLPDGMTVADMQQLPSLQRLLGVVIGLLPLGFLVFGVIRLRQTLNELQRGAIFAARTIGYLRTFAGAVFASVSLASLERPLRAIALNLTSDHPSFEVRLDVTSNEVLLLLVCGLFYLIAAIMHEGRRLGEENEGFI